METTTNTTELKATKTDIWKVPFALIEIVEGLNIRSELGNIEELAESIRENGVKVPFRGWRENERYFLVDGHRRYAACALLANEGIELTVPFLVERKPSDEKRVIDMFITNEGKQLTPLEQAEGVRRLLNYGYEQKDIATKIGKSQAYISKLAALADAPKKLTNLIVKGKVSASVVMDMISNGGAEKFIEDYEAGKYDNHTTTTNGKEKKITSKSVKEKTSWQTFKEYASQCPSHLMTEDKKRIFGMMCKVMNNEYAEADFIAYFEK